MSPHVYSLINVTKTVFFFRVCIQANKLNIEASRNDKLSLPGFENLTAGYNKFLRPNFGGKLFTSAQKDRSRSKMQQKFKRLSEVWVDSVS